MSIHIYFISAHLEYFPYNRVDYSEKQKEFFNQDILTMEDIYQGNVLINILDNYCWSLKNYIKYLKGNQIIEIIF